MGSKVSTAASWWWPVGPPAPKRATPRWWPARKPAAGPPKRPKRRVFVSKTNYRQWLCVNKMVVSEQNPHKKDLFQFEKANKETFVDTVKRELRDFGSIKASLDVQIRFKREGEEEGEEEYIENYFREEHPEVFQQNDDENKIKQYFESTFEKINNQIDKWVKEGSGWEVDQVQLVYLNVAPPKLKSKKAIINLQNSDDECLKWALRAALFPPLEGKKVNRPRSYPVNDGIDWSGISFPTPIKQIDRLEVQNRGLGINGFGWEEDCVIVHRISKREKSLPRINLMLVESGEKQHYCFVKRVSALLYDQSKHHDTKHYCMLCLSGFSS